MRASRAAAARSRSTCRRPADAGAADEPALDTSAPPRPRPCRSPRAERRLLLVEDEPGLQLTLTDRLVAEGYSVETAGDGEPAWPRATAEPST